MNLNKYLLFFISLCIFTLISCQNKKQDIQRVITLEKTQKEDPFIESHIHNVHLEQEDIDLFLKRYDWKMTDSGSGLRYELLKQGKGNHPDSLDIVTLSYHIYLLNGEEIYNSDKDGLKIFKVEKDREVSGLHEAVRMMRVGDVMRLIMPSHLAYGLIGDRDKIPMNASLAYQIKLIKIDKPKLYK